MSKRYIVLALVALMLALPTAAFADHGPTRAVPPGGTFYANDDTYRSVVTPAHLPNKGNFDILYMFPDCEVEGGCAPVSDAAPGDTDYNGGRWHVHLAYGITGQLTNSDDVEGQATSIEATDLRFSCPLIPTND